MAALGGRRTRHDQRELDQLGERLLAEQGARSAPRLTYDFSGATCISIDEQAVHGIRVVRAGDVLNIDVSVELDGYFADTGGTTVVPPTVALKTHLCHATRTALAGEMKSAQAGQPISRIGADGWTLTGVSGTSRRPTHIR